MVRTQHLILKGRHLIIVNWRAKRTCEPRLAMNGQKLGYVYFEVEPGADVAKAEAYFERALAVARQQQARSWELRAAMSMARLWRDQGKPQQARELLARIYGWFTEGDTRDLKEAKALFEELQRPVAVQR